MGHTSVSIAKSAIICYERMLYNFFLYLLLVFPKNDWLGLLNIYRTVSGIAQNTSASFLDYQTGISKLVKQLKSGVLTGISNEQANDYKGDFSE